MPGKKKKGGGKKSSKKKGKKGGKSGGEGGDELKEMLDKRFYMGPYHERDREKKLKQKINDAFKMFERHTEGPVDPGERVCDCREVRTIVRALDLNPTKEQLRMMLEEIEESEPAQYIKYHKLEALMLQVLKDKEYIPKAKKFAEPTADGEDGAPYQSTLLVRDSEERIIEAFRTLDKHNQGYLDAETFGKTMMEMGRTKDEAFDREEVVDMIQAAADPETGVIKYEDSLYVDQLAYD